MASIVASIRFTPIAKFLGIKSRTKKKFRVTTTDSNHELHVTKNVLGRALFRKYRKTQKPCESFFGMLKTEWIYGNKKFATRKDAEKAVLEYIEVFYNRERLLQVLG